MVTVGRLPIPPASLLCFAFAQKEYFFLFVIFLRFEFVSLYARVSTAIASAVSALVSIVSFWEPKSRQHADVANCFTFQCVFILRARTHTHPNYIHSASITLHSSSPFLSSAQILYFDCDVAAKVVCRRWSRCIHRMNGTKWLCAAQFDRDIDS